MLRIQKLSRPNKHSGHKLEPGKSTKVRGLTVVNTNSFDVYVDPFTRKKVKAKRKAKKSPRKKK